MVSGNGEDADGDRSALGNDFDANNLEEDEDTDDEDEDSLEMLEAAAGLDSEEGAKHRQAILDSSDLSAQEKVRESIGSS